MFLATNGERLGATWLTGQVHHYVEARGRARPAAATCSATSAATLMLEGGADIRYVQELLGHRDLASTHIYTRVAPERLAAIHAATHPAAGRTAQPEATSRRCATASGPSRVLR